MIDLYDLAYAVLILTGGTLGDPFGQRRIFIIGVLERDHAGRKARRPKHDHGLASQPRGDALFARSSSLRSMPLRRQGAGRVNHAIKHNDRPKKRLPVTKGGRKLAGRWWMRPENGRFPLTAATLGTIGVTHTGHEVVIFMKYQVTKKGCYARTTLLRPGRSSARTARRPGVLRGVCDAAA
jgi:hypothetical protein